MNEIAAKLMGNSFYEKITVDPENAQEWMKRMQEMFNVIVCNSPWALRFIPDYLKTNEMCDEAVCTEPRSLECVPGHLKIERICKEAVRTNSLSLAYVPDLFKTP